MKNIFFCLFIFFSLILKTYAQEVLEIEESNKETESLLLDLTSEEDVSLFLKKISTLESLKEIILEGEADSKTFQKIFSHLVKVKKLESLTFRDNNFDKFPENIKAIKSLKSLTIEENSNADFNDLFLKLSSVNIKELNLIDNELVQNLTNLEKLTSLTNLNITGSSELNYENLVEQLIKLPNLKVLALPVNFLSELPQNIINLKALEVLDVSNNSLLELPSEASSLKKLNSLSIQGNLIMDVAKELEKFANTNIKFLTLDKDISEQEKEQILKLFPGIEIYYVNEPEVDEKEITEDLKPEETVKTGNLKIKKEFKILSTAYLLFPSIVRDYNFDTLGINGRYLHPEYSNIYRRIPNSQLNPGDVVLYRLKGSNVNKGKRKEIWFHLPNSYGTTNKDYIELNAFRGMYWVYKGGLSKKEFKKKYLKKSWQDIRINQDQNNSGFTILLKSGASFESFFAYPIINKEYPLEKNHEIYNTRFLSYQKALTRRMKKFHTKHVRDRKKYDNNYDKRMDLSFLELQRVMSEREKIMSRQEWIEYYDAIMEDEAFALNNAPINFSYLQRSLTLQSYSIRNAPIRPDPRNPNLNFVTASFIDEQENTRLAVTTVFVLDNNSRSFYQINNNSGDASIFPIIQNSNYTLIVLLRNGNFGTVSSAEIDIQNILPGNPIIFRVKMFDKNLNTMEELLKAGLK
ncbi:MAG: leucine-rich repeat domain-containing protein [Bacteroidota bacterium]|nr:leucine-rich repeat domain-containing protein [Bacteroidota bacterium]